LQEQQQHRKHAVPAQPASVFDCFPGGDSDPDSEAQQDRTTSNPKPAASRTASSSKHTLQHSSADLDLFGSNAGAARQQQHQQPNKSAAAIFGRPARKEAAASVPDGPSWLQPLGLPSARLPDAAAAAAAVGSSKQQTNRSSLPVFTLPGLTGAADSRATALKPAAAAGCQIMSAQGELELVLLSQDKHAACGFDSDDSLGSMQQVEEEQEEEQDPEQTMKRTVPAAATAQGKLGSGSRQLKDPSSHYQQQQQQQQQQQRRLAASKQSKFGSEFDFAADSQVDGSEGSQGAGDEAESSGYSDSLSDSLSDGDSDSGSDGAAADAAASPSSGSLWSGGSSSSGGSSGEDAGSADDSDVSFVAEQNSRKRKLTGRGPAGLKRPRQQGATAAAAAAKAAHKAVRFADEDGGGHVASDLQQQRKQLQQQQKKTAAQRRSSLKAGSSHAARGSSVVLELGAVLPGEVSTSDAHSSSS
jgi:hypothetical protein